MTFIPYTSAMADENNLFNESINNFITQSNETSQVQTSESTSDVRLQDDFYQSVNGKWLKTAQANVNSLLKEDSSFSELQEKNDDKIKEIITDLAANKSQHNSDSDETKIVNLYNNTLNLKERNKQGIQPIKQYLDKI